MTLLSRSLSLSFFLSSLSHFTPFRFSLTYPLIFPRPRSRHTIHAEYLIMPIVSPITRALWLENTGQSPDILRGPSAFKARDFAWIFQEGINGAILLPANSSSSIRFPRWARERRVEGLKQRRSWIKGSREEALIPPRASIRRGRIATREIRRAYIPRMLVHHLC